MLSIKESILKKKLSIGIPTIPKHGKRQYRKSKFKEQEALQY